MNQLTIVNWRRLIRFLTVFVAAAFLIVSFQNCQGFEQNDLSAIPINDSTLDSTIEENVLISSFLAAQPTINAGESTMLTWNVSSAKTLTLNPGNINVSGLSSYTASPQTSTIYTLVAENSKGSVSSSLTVTVVAVPAPVAPSIASFTASSATITAGQSTTLNWSVSNTTSLRLDPGNLNVTGMNSATVTPIANTTYTLTATNAVGSVNRTLAIVVNAAPIALPVINTFTTAGASIIAGQSTTLNWTTTGAQSLKIDPGNINVTGKTSQVITPSATTTYTLTATNASGSVINTLLITVTAAPSVPVISSFSATNTLITAGQMTTLSWSATGAQTLKIDPGNVDVTGKTSQVMTPATTTNYILTATNATGSVTRTALITVMPGATTGKILEVGPGKAFASLSAAASSSTLAAGDTILVYHSATAYGSARLTRAGTATQKITIRGVPSANGERPIISGGTNTIEAAANYYVIENLDIRGGSFRCFFHRANDITVKNSIIRNCPAHGILSADDGSGKLTLDSVEVTACGNGTQEHPIYVTSDQKTYPGSVIRIMYSYIHDNNGGNAIKSRAERNEFYYNWVESSLYRAMELIGPDSDVSGVTPRLIREDSDIVGNVIRQTNSQPLFRLGGDKDNSDTLGRYRFVNNTILMNSTSAVFQLFLGLESVEMHNNIFYRSGGSRIIDEANADWTGGRQVSGSNNWVSTGSSSVPSEWTGSLQGTDPGFVALASFNVRLSANSILLNKGNPAPASNPNHPFINPLALPLETPSIRTVGTGGARIRSPASSISIGAFER